MCGLLGAVKLDTGFTDEEKILLEANLDKIAYRGPDAYNQKYFSTIENKQNNIYFGHRRLSIIDLSDEGIQPLTNDGKIHIIFNGEIYNYIELRESLKSEGVEFKTNTDTEVIINLYKQEGVEGFHKMNGMWAFILFDQTNNKVIACRDRFSIKPLYLYNKDGLWVFSSEIKQIIPFITTLKPNLNVLGNYLYNYIIDYSNETFFQEINKLPPKHVMIIDLGKKSVEYHKYWDYNIESREKYKKESLIEEFKYLFEDAVKIRLRSDVKVGNTLSGGLDSSSIAVVADKFSASKLQNLSVITKNKKHSEERFVDLLVNKKGINVHKISNDETNPWSKVENVIWHNDEPILSLSTVAHFNMMSSFKKETDITVIMSGQGGDETLAGYNKYYFYNLIQSKRERRYKRLLKEGFHILPKLIGEFQLKAAKRYIPFLSEQGTILDKVCGIDYNDAFKGLKFTNFYSRQILDIDKYSVPALTHYEDRSSMHQSLEIRLPFLDYRLVNFNINLPLELKINNGFSKYILREAITDLPKGIAWRKDKKGFNIDEKVFFNSITVEYIKNLFKDSLLEKWGIIDAKKFITEFQLFVNNKTNYWVRNVNRVIFAEIWAQKFFN